MSLFVLPVSALLCWPILALAQQAPHANHRQLFREVESRVLTLRAQSAITARDLTLLKADLDALYEEVVRDSNALVNRRAKQVMVESDGIGLFEQEPILPPERKNGQNWAFQTTRLEVVPRHLFVYAVRLKGDHTLRLRRVVLHFRDGTRRAFDDWYALEGGNGRALSRSSSGLELKSYGEGEVPQARALAAIEILGSAQDGSHEARLQFRFAIPDPADRPFAAALAQLEVMRSNWFTGQTQAAQVALWMQDLKRLGAALDLPTAALLER